MLHLASLVFFGFLYSVGSGNTKPTPAGDWSRHNSSLQVNTVIQSCLCLWHFDSCCSYHKDFLPKLLRTCYVNKTFLSGCQLQEINFFLRAWVNVIFQCKNVFNVNPENSRAFSVFSTVLLVLYCELNIDFIAFLFTSSFCWSWFELDISRTSERSSLVTEIPSWTREDKSHTHKR